MKIEISDYLDAFGERHICRYKGYQYPHDLKIGWGCENRIYLQTGFSAKLVQAILKNNNEPVSIKRFNNIDHFEEIKVAIVEQIIKSECSRCGSPLLISKP